MEDGRGDEGERQPPALGGGRRRRPRLMIERLGAEGSVRRRHDV
jgi:hypothetical protein